jgi:hypothetical protein
MVLLEIGRHDRHLVNLVYRKQYGEALHFQRDQMWKAPSHGKFVCNFMTSIITRQ